MSGGHLEFVSHYHFHQNLVILGLSFWFSFIIECFQRWAPLTAVIAVFILVVSLHNWLVLLRFSFVYFHILSLSLLSSSGSLLHTFTLSYFHLCLFNTRLTAKLCLSNLPKADCSRFTLLVGLPPLIRCSFLHLFKEWYSDLPQVWRRRWSHQLLQELEAGLSWAFLTPGGQCNDTSLCFLKQTLSFQPPAMEILRQRVRLLAEAAPSSAESPQVDPHGPPQALSQSPAPPSQPLGDPLGTTPGRPSWTGSPPTKRPPTFSRITRFTTRRAREFTNTNQLVPRGSWQENGHPCHRVIVCK